VVQAIKENLREQGVPVAKVSLYGYVEDGADATVLSSSSSPKKGVAAAPAKETSFAGAPQEAELEPEVAAVAYKARMAQSNVSFA
jgi:hypothetical protein